MNKNIVPAGEDSVVHPPLASDMNVFHRSGELNPSEVYVYREGLGGGKPRCPYRAETNQKPTTCRFNLLHIDSDTNIAVAETITDINATAKKILTRLTNRDVVGNITEGTCRECRLIGRDLILEKHK